MLKTLTLAALVASGAAFILASSIQNAHSGADTRISALAKTFLPSLVRWNWSIQYFGSRLLIVPAVWLAGFVWETRLIIEASGPTRLLLLGVILIVVATMLLKNLLVWLSSSLGATLQEYVTRDLRLGTIGHPWEHTLCVFGESLVAQVEEPLIALLGPPVRRS